MTAQSPPGHCEFFQWLFEHKGLCADHYRAKSLNRRISACLRAVGASDIDEARRRIGADPLLARPAINAVLLGVTEFSRDTAVFESLRSQIIPTFRGRETPVRIWSAACSEGHELYSVAMLLSDEQLLDGSELLGTDCRSDAIQRARAGIYRTDMLNSVCPAMRTRFFDSSGRTARISASLRSTIRWKRADLFTGAEPGPWDMILWRNMAIYLNVESANRIWHCLVRSIRDGGYLVVGKADHPPARADLKRIGTCIYQKRQDSL